MKRFTNGKLLDKDVAAENLEVDGWQKPITTKESPQTIRNVGHIDQLAAGQADLWKNVKRIEQSVNYSWLFQRATRSHLPGPCISWQEAADAVDIIYGLDEDVSLWQQAQLAIQPIAPPYHEKLTTVTKLFGELEEDFDELPNRIVRCELLEKELSAFEESLEGDETECLAWCVSLIRDVLDYNNAENLTETYLGLLKRAIKLIAEKGPDCNKEDYKNLHKEFLEAGIALIPTTQKAIDRYGQ